MLGLDLDSLNQDILRTPLWGRAFESMGEDPFLTSSLAVDYIRGLQSEGVIGDVKHFAANNQEFQRFSISAEVDERTLREIYLPAFEKAVKKARPWTVMCAYNKLNGTFASEHRGLLTEILKEEVGARIKARLHTQPSAGRGTSAIG